MEAEFSYPPTPWVEGHPAIAACVGFSSWKQPQARALLTQPLGKPPSFHRRASDAVNRACRQRGAVAAWPSRAPKGLESAAMAAEVPLVWVEDGFLRSRGLGAECRPAISLVCDHTGLHFDPSRPSDLERLLTHSHFDADLVGRAERLVERIVALGLTKYNLAGKTAAPSHTGQRTVLVAGQVEDDLSVRLGGAGITSNLTLLHHAREIERHSIILYKPHPDVEAGHRKGAHADATVRRFADHIVRDVTLPALLEQVDAVHVLTSLTGFEALLRGCEVICHGQPFFAGWGLTRDLKPLPRRHRKLNLMELAAAALILYPRYLDPATGAPCSPETVVDHLANSTGDEGMLPTLRRLQGMAQKLTASPQRAA
jgi:capsular polysaccharide export protein